jgi:uncharacterized protein YydD (DUF2326 family)
MRLIRLSANMPSFRAIEFNQTGVSIVSARRRTNSNDRTYNSVGKSLAIYLIHFCLGAKATNDFIEKLPEWIFRLDFELDGKNHYALRSTANSNKIIYNGEEVNIKTFTQKMGQSVFYLDDGVKYLSFRSLIARFIRQGKAGYTKFDKFKSQESSPVDIINTAYLLGLNVESLIKKVELKEEDDLLKTQDKNLTKDPVLQSLLLGSGRPEDLELRLLDLDKQIDKLQNDIRNFVIAEDYGSIKKEADAISKELFSLRNVATKYKIALDNIAKSSERKPDVNKETLIQFFNEANVALGQSVVKQLDDVERFNNRLITDRVRILEEQRKKYEAQLRETGIRIEELQAKENEKLQYLNSHGALDDYTRLTELLSNCRTQKEKLEQYKVLQRTYKQKREELKRTIADENLKTQRYLDQIENLTKRHMSFFHDLAREFYSDKTAGLQILNNEGINKLRYKIEARISDDSGDGVNETKIFCFDWTILTGEKNSKVRFLVHDNRIISETDPRQVATMLRIANRLSKERNYQYILTVNESSLNLLKKEMTEEEYTELVTSKEVLQLDDSSDSAKLLGIQVDLKYE